MTFEPHPEMPGAYFAFAGKFSFLVIRDDAGAWRTSWQDQEKGGSASNTIEGPFANRFQAEANCRRIANELKRKN